MSGGLFAREEKVAERATGALSEAGQTVRSEEMETLLKGYEKLLKQTKKLMRISDRSDAGPLTI